MLERGSGLSDDWEGRREFAAEPVRDLIRGSPSRGASGVSGGADMVSGWLVSRRGEKSGVFGR